MKRSVWLIILIFCLSASGFANDIGFQSDELIRLIQEQRRTIEDLKKVIESQDQKISDIESKINSIDSQSGSVDQSKKLSTMMSRLQFLESEQASSWSKNVKLGGDLRYRHELIDDENLENTKKGEGEQRNRNRIRARIGLDAKVNDEVDAKFRLATGQADPTSTNQTLNDAFTKKDIWLDMAYFDYHPVDISGLNVLGGRMPNPFYMPGKSPLIWDGDLNLEGVALTHRTPVGSFEMFSNLGGFWIDEKSTSNDIWLLGAQCGLKKTIGKNYFLFGPGFYHYSGLRGQPTLDWEAKGKGYGNTLSSGNYAEDFNELQLFAEAGFDVLSMPVAVFGDYVQNIKASNSEDTGWLAGLRLNRCKEPRTWEFNYYYKLLEKDAVVGAFTDSDFVGGGTNGKGHVFNLGYQISKGWKTGATYFYNEKGVNINERDYHRLQLDLEYKF